MNGSHGMLSVHLSLRGYTRQFIVAQQNNGGQNVSNGSWMHRHQHHAAYRVPLTTFFVPPYLCIYTIYFSQNGTDNSYDTHTPHQWLHSAHFRVICWTRCRDERKWNELKCSQSVATNDYIFLSSSMCTPCLPFVSSVVAGCAIYKYIVWQCRRSAHVFVILQCVEQDLRVHGVLCKFHERCKLGSLQCTALFNTHTCTYLYSIYKIEMMVWDR